MSSDWIFKSQAMMAPIEQRYEMQANQMMVQAGRDVQDAAHRMSEAHLKNRAFAIQSQRLDMIQTLKMRELGIRDAELLHKAKELELEEKYRARQQRMYGERTKASMTRRWFPSDKPGMVRMLMPKAGGGYDWIERTEEEAKRLNPSIYPPSGRGAQDLRQRLAAEEDIEGMYTDRMEKLFTKMGVQPSAARVALSSQFPNFLTEEQYEAAKQQLGVFQPHEKVEKDGQAGYVLFEPKLFSRLYEAYAKHSRRRDRDMSLLDQ